MAVRSYAPGAFLVTLLLAAAEVLAAAAPADEDIVVHVRKDGPDVTAEVDCPVDAPRSVIWEVLTDYDHMAQFVSNLESSGVEEREGNVLRVHQKGKVSMGPFTVRFDNVRMIELVPFDEIRSRMISGDMKASRFVTRIVQVGAKVHIVNSGRYTPDMWVPPFIGPAFLEAQTRKQFGEIRAEALRRSAAN